MNHATTFGLKFLTAIGAATIGLLLSSGQTHAAGPAHDLALSSGEMTATITSTLTVSGTSGNPVAIAISTHYTVPVAQIDALHDSGWGYGNIVKLHEYALASGKSVSEVQALRESGMGWGQIAKTLNLPKGAKTANLGSIMRKNAKAVAPAPAQATAPRKAVKIKKSTVQRTQKKTVVRKTTKSRVTIAPRKAAPAKKVKATPPKAKPVKKAPKSGKK